MVLSRVRRRSGQGISQLEPWHKDVRWIGVRDSRKMETESSSDMFIYMQTREYIAQNPRRLHINTPIFAKTSDPNHDL
jgi:hypothetical protein